MRVDPWRIMYCEDPRLSHRDAREASLYVCPTESAAVIVGEWALSLSLKLSPRNVSTINHKISSCCNLGVSDQHVP